MKKLNLAGEWLLARDGGTAITGRLPGCTYLDYMNNGMEDPFWGENETQANELARHDYRYSREFELTDEMLGAMRLELVADGLDTLCAVTVNGHPVGETANINRLWRFDLKGLCRAGMNTVAIDIKNPYPVIEERQKAAPLPAMGMPLSGVGHLRKTPCHFGWDWGPALPPAGLTRSIGVEAYDVRIEDVRIRQTHSDGRVDVTVAAKIDAQREADISGRLTLTHPDGRVAEYAATGKDARLEWQIAVEEPQLWWCNGLGGQPLYHLDVALYADGVEADSLHRKIGLRTIELDTAPDVHGRQFRFIINGLPIFAKGANWIPADSFITRSGPETMDFYVRQARHANMNMLRVWGGGMYESEDFYDACDRHGILVWQDFAFACNPYPFHDKAFLDDLHHEVADNIRRLRHRASLALWCGNNENEILLFAWGKKSRERTSNPHFYHNILPEWVKKWDDVTPYWPGSPSSGDINEQPHNMKAGQTRGDTHLWNIWHGMRPIEAFRAYPTRFCSEYGMESLPSMHTIRSFTGEDDPDLFSPVMRLHQKCGSGNEKILYYLLAKYRNPAKFEDFVYLSQLVQAATVRFATDCWRRNIGHQNGALFWQMNDCWPVASWAGIDYEKQLKAVIYHARHFNKPLCLINDYYKNRVELYIVNEQAEDVVGRMEWTLTDFDGQAINSGGLDVTVVAVASARVAVLRFADILKGKKKREAVLSVSLTVAGELRDEKSWLLVPDKDAALRTVDLSPRVSVSDGIASVTLTARHYARYVYVEADGVTAPWSDNFFDIAAGGSVTLTVELPPDIDGAELEKRLRIKTLADVTPKNSRLKDRWLRFAMMMSKQNCFGWLLFKLLAVFKIFF